MRSANVDRGEEAEDIFGGFRKLSELRFISEVDNTKAFGKPTPLRHGSSAGVLSGSDGLEMPCLKSSFESEFSMGSTSTWFIGASYLSSSCK